MQVYATEEEQVESLKKWWKENGRSILAGLVIGLGGVFGWRAWVAHQASVGEQASMLFEQLMASVSAGAADSADKQAEQLISEYGATPYAVFAAFAMARMHVSGGDNAAARSQLRWVLETTKDPGLKQIARLRLARILLADGDVQGAEEALAGQAIEGFGGEVAAVKGDIALARGDIEEARAAYEDALAGGAGNGALLRMKIDNLATQPEQASAATDDKTDG